MGNGVDLPSFNSIMKLKEEMSSTESDIILRDRWIMIPHSLQQRVVSLAHMGHQGIVKTKSLIRKKVWLPYIDVLVEKEVRKCHACQVSKLTVTREPLNMSPLPTKLWTEVSTDFGKVPGHDIHFMVISDELSRYPVVETVTALTARAVIPVLDKVRGQFGVMETLKSDNGPHSKAKPLLTLLKQNDSIIEKSPVTGLPAMPRWRDL